MAIKNIFNLDVDVKQKNYINEPIVTQNDKVVFILRLTDNGLPFDLTGVTTYTLVSVRPDKQSVQTLGIKTAVNEITFNLGSTEISVPGEVNAAIQLYDANGRVSSIPFSYMVLKDLVKDYVPSENEKTLIELVLSEGPAILAAAKQATVNANQATSKANASADKADLATSNANRGADNADEASSRADAASDNVHLAITDAELATAKTIGVTAESVLATTEANEAALNANTKADLAQTRIDELNVLDGEIATTIDGANLAARKAITDGDYARAQGVIIDDKITGVNALTAYISADFLPSIADTLVGFDEAIDVVAEKAGSNDLEIVNARGSYGTLRQRLDDTNTHFDTEKDEYINLGKYWDALRNGKIYTVEFNQYSVSPSPIGTKLEDNEDLICEPSTNTFRGQNDYENIGLFMSIDVNGYVDENDDYHVIAMKGDGRFKADGTNGDVWVMAMPGYIKRYFDDDVWRISYSDVPHPGFEILDEAVKPDGTFRPFLLHAKYVAGRGKDGHLASISGVYPEYLLMSHDSQITKFKEKGKQYSGKTSHDDFYASLMLYLKYATTNPSTAMRGARSYYLQYTAAISEENATRIIVTNAQANNLVVGSTVSIGDFGGGAINVSRDAAQNFNIANRVNILSITPLDDGVNTAVYIDVAAPFTTTKSSTITTYPWNSGSCDNVLGTDGSPWDNQSGKEPYIVNGIEVIVGGYEIIQNLIIYNNNTNPTDYKIEVYANYDCYTYATSQTADYDLVGYTLAQTNAAWSYLTKIGIDNKHPSIMMPVEAGGTSTTGFGDGIYTNAPITATRAWLSFGHLDFGARVGPRYLNAGIASSYSSWAFLGRLSATGRSRRRA